MRRFVSRFMPAKRPSRFSSRRISTCSQRSAVALPFSTFPATCLAKPPPQWRDVPRILVCILDVISNFGTPVPDPRLVLVVKILANRFRWPGSLQNQRRSNFCDKPRILYTFHVHSAMLVECQIIPVG